MYNLERDKGTYIMRIVVILSHHYFFFVANREKVSAIYLKSYNCLCDENAIARSENISSFCMFCLQKWPRVINKSTCLEKFMHSLKPP